MYLSVPISCLNSDLRGPFLEQELLTLPEFTPFFSGVRVTQSLVLWGFL